MGFQYHAALLRKIRVLRWAESLLACQASNRASNSLQHIIDLAGHGAWEAIAHLGGMAGEW